MGAVNRKEQGEEVNRDNKEGKRVDEKGETTTEDGIGQ